MRSESVGVDASQAPSAAAPPVVVERANFPRLLEALTRRGFRVVGPTVRDGAIVYDEIHSEADLPVGCTDRQDAGAYRLESRADGALFGYNVGPHSWKRFLHPPLVPLWSGRRSENTLRTTPADSAAARYAFLGVRSCELRAIAIQDRVFLGGSYVDHGYQQRRSDACVIAVNCGVAGGTCFCVSMNAGPRCESDFDLCLTEALTADRHYFIVEIGSALGAELIDETPHVLAVEEDLATVERIVSDTAALMGRSLDTSDIHGLLLGNLRHSRWDEVANRCLSCGNCTMVCPTCFCTTVEDVTELSGERVERMRRWDSCFTADFTYIHGGSVRASGKSRYRQWLTHKLATWYDQFGTSGCVGCGRCITWCPVGIDLTVEAAAIRATGEQPNGAYDADA